MSLITLYVGNHPVEIDPRTSIPLNFQVADADNIGDILTNYTNSFLIPDTDYNRQVLHNFSIINQIAPPITLDAQLLINGRNLFGGSNLLLLDFKEGEGWNCAFIGARGSTALDGSIQDIDYSFLAPGGYFFTVPQVEQYNKLSTGLIWGISDQLGTDLQIDGLIYSQVIDVEKHLFQVRVVDIITGMFQDANIPVRLFNTVSDLFARLVIPCDTPKKRPDQWEGVSVVAEVGGDYTPVFNLGIAVPIFNTVISGNESGRYNPATGIISLDAGGKWSVEINLSVTVSTALTSIRYLAIASDPATERGSAQVLPFTEFNPEGVAGTYSITYSRQFETMTAPVPNGGRVYVYLVGFNGDVIKAGSSFKATLSDVLTYGNGIDVGRSLPNISQIDFFKEITKLTNVVVQLREGEVQLMNFDRLPYTETVDLSKRLDTTKGHELAINPDSWAKTNDFMYTNQDDVGEGFGGARVTIKNPVLLSYMEKMKLQFSASEQRVLIGMIQCMSIPSWEITETPAGGTLSRSGGSGSRIVNTSENHLLKVNDYIRIPLWGNLIFIVGSVQSPTQFTFSSLSPTTFNGTAVSWLRVTFKFKEPKLRIGFVADYAPGGDQIWLARGNEKTELTQPFKRVLFAGDGLTYSLMLDDLLKRFFRVWLGTAERYRKIRAHFSLEDNDVFGINFFKTYYIDKFGTTFFLAKVNQYTGSDESTECELLALVPPLPEDQIQPL